VASLDLVGKLLTPSEELPRSRVTVRDGRVAAIEPWPGPAPVEALDVGGGWIAPGLIDVQINGAFGQDFSDPRADLEVAARGLLAHGVTAFLPTVVTLPWRRYPDVIENLGRQPRGGAASLGVHLEGPFLAPRYHGAHPAEHLALPSPAHAESLLAHGPVRMLTLAPELPGAVDTIKCLTRRDVVVSLGHSAASFEQARLGLLNGARAGTHLFNAMVPFHHREPGLAGALFDDRRALVGVIADGIHVHPALLAVAWRALGSERMLLVTDAIAALGMPPGQYLLGEKTVGTTRTEARLADGTLAGSMLRLDAAVRTLVQRAGCPLRDAVTMASATPARLLGVEDRRGSVAVGREADLVVLGPDLRVRATLLAGVVAFRSTGGDP
jgi:N-acetylglucosamine-6-phosphate deacetylase